MESGMTEQLYQVRDFSEHRKLLMIAPVDTIKLVFQLDKAALHRMVRETNVTMGISILHFNSRGPILGAKAVAVAKFAQEAA
jgi:ACT domain-containing protein